MWVHPDLFVTVDSLTVCRHMRVGMLENTCTDKSGSCAPVFSALLSALSLSLQSLMSVQTYGRAYTHAHTFFITHVHTYSVHRYVEAHVRTPFASILYNMAYVVMACIVMAYIVVACRIMAYIAMAYVVMDAHLLLPFAAHLRVVAKLCPAYVCMRTNVHACVHVCAALRARVCMRACVRRRLYACIQSSSVHGHVIEGYCNSIRWCAASPKTCVHALAHALKLLPCSHKCKSMNPAYVDSFVST